VERLTLETSMLENFYIKLTGGEVVTTSTVVMERSESQV
jgi:hypothetical protein